MAVNQFWPWETFSRSEPFSIQTLFVPISIHQHTWQWMKDYFFRSQLHDVCDHLFRIKSHHWDESVQIWSHLFRLITALGWEYAILIVAGLVLTCIAFGCLMRPLESSQASASKVNNPFLKMCCSPPIFSFLRRTNNQKKKSHSHWATESQQGSQHQRMEKLKMDISSFHPRWAWCPFSHSFSFFSIIF